jgi:hypothetical protein
MVSDSDYCGGKKKFFLNLNLRIMIHNKLSVTSTVLLESWSRCETVRNIKRCHGHQTGPWPKT